LCTHVVAAVFTTEIVFQFNMGLGSYLYYYFYRRGARRKMLSEFLVRLARAEHKSVKLASVVTI